MTFLSALSIFLTLAALGLLAAGVTPYLSRPPKGISAKRIDLVSHFAVQYLVAALALGGLCFWLKMPAPLYIFTAAAGLCVTLLMPFLPGPRRKIPPDAVTLKVLQVNVLKTNRNTEMLHGLILDEQPDVIVGAEVTQDFADMFGMLKDEYPHGMVNPQPGSYGLAVLSKYPLQDAQHANLHCEKVPSDIFTIAPQGRAVTFCSLHPQTPQSSIGNRDGEFAAVAARFKDAPDAKTGRLVVLGDFNATPWCPALRRMTGALKLENARHGRGIFGTWPSFFPLPMLRLPIDLVLYRGNIYAADFALGPFIGSDHLPTLTTFVLGD